jgi:nucleoside-diphosphate-sugar epimerase
MAERELVIITGTTGRIGAELAGRLAERYRVVAFDRHPERSAPAAEATFPVDVTNAESLHTAVAQVRERFGTRVASVVHLVAYYSFSGEPDPQHEEVNVQGTQRLLHALQPLQVEQFLFASTMNVHQPCQLGERIDEEWPLDREQEWQYPRSKAQAEDLLRAEHGDVPLAIVRIASVYEEWCRHPVLARQMQRIYERSLLGHFFPGNPAHGLTYLHMEDLLEALVQTVERRAELPAETVLLLGEPEPVSYGALQEELGRLLHSEEWSTHSVPPPLAKAGAWVQDHLPGGDPFIKPWMIAHADDHYALDIGRARRLLDWEPQRTLLQALPTLAERLKAEPERWYQENDLETEGEQQTT